MRESETARRQRIIEPIDEDLTPVEYIALYATERMRREDAETALAAAKKRIAELEAKLKELDTKIKALEAERARSKN
jgi:chromosome segregation ATPase